MQPESEQMVRAVRSEIEDEHKTLQNLQKKFTHPGMKDRVKRALSDLDDATMFLDLLNKEKRTAVQETYVIHSAQIPLQWAISKRKQLQASLDKYGADAELFPWP